MLKEKENGNWKKKNVEKDFAASVFSNIMSFGYTYIYICEYIPLLLRS